MNHRFADFYADRNRPSDSASLPFSLTDPTASDPQMPESQARFRCGQKSEPPEASNAPETRQADEETLAIIREAANRQWKQLQSFGVQSNELLKLAGAIWESIKLGSTMLEAPESDCETLISGFPAAEDAIYTDPIIPPPAPMVETTLSPCLGTIKLGNSADSALVVSLERFFQFSFTVSEGLNRLVESNQSQR